MSWVRVPGSRGDEVGTVGAAVDLGPLWAVLVGAADREQVSIHPDDGDGQQKREPLQYGQPSNVQMLQILIEFSGLDPKQKLEEDRKENKLRSVA